jgi:hypothetical protein
MTRLVAGHGALDDKWPNISYMRRYLQPRMFCDRIGNDNAAIIYSSGSTGRPKGILIAHRNLADGADIVAEYLGTEESDRIGCVLSFNFDYGLRPDLADPAPGRDPVSPRPGPAQRPVRVSRAGVDHRAAGHAGDHQQDVRQAAQARRRRLRFLRAALRVLDRRQAVRGHADGSEDHLPPRQDLFHVRVDRSVPLHLPGPRQAGFAPPRSARASRTAR